MGRFALYTLAGLAAGLLTWIGIDLLGLIRISDQVGALSAAEARQYQFAGMTWGAALGVLLGLADLLASGARAQWPRVVGIGLAVGLVAGVIGLTVGMTAFGALYTFPARTALHFLGNVLARAIGWAFIGALAGTADGWRKLNAKVGRNGFLGGLLGGLLGGVTFEIVPYLLPGIRSGPTARLLGFTITGAMIGLFVALARRLFTEAWVRVVLGRNEGKEFLIERAETTIGRAELSDIPLFGDPQIARAHAVLTATGSGYQLRDTGESPLGTLVNGVRIAGVQPLSSGDTIQIGAKTLVFFERQVRERTAPAARDLPRPASGPLPGVSPYALPVSAPGREWRAVVTGGPHAGAVFAVRPGTTIGREPVAEIVLSADTKVSRLHARFVADGADLAIEDAGSTNGTFVNGRPVTRIALRAGDTILVGSTTLRLDG